MTIVCFDTNVLIWGIKGEATSGQEEMIPRTKKFLEQLEKEKTHIVIPSVVLAEFFMNIPVERHNENVDILTKAFLVSPIDARTSSLFAQIWQKNKNNGFPHNGDNIREKIKIDYLVVATALSNKAEIIYSNDKHIKKFAAELIEVSDIPIIPEQLPLI